MLYQFIFRFLFALAPEYTYRRIFLKRLHFWNSFALGRLWIRLIHRCYKRRKADFCNIRLDSCLGLAAGVDIDGKYADDLSNLGFAFIEVGSMTSMPTENTSKRRLFNVSRALPDRAYLSNGEVYSKGVLDSIKYLKDRSPKTMVGGNICKMPSSTSAEAVQDIEKAFALVYDFVDFVIINLGMDYKGDSLQDPSFLHPVLEAVTSLRSLYDVYKPIVVKISNDISVETLDGILDCILHFGVDAIETTNCTFPYYYTLKTRKLKYNRWKNSVISGSPLFEKNLSVVKHIHEYTHGNLPIIAVGGIDSPTRAKAMLEAGATLLEIQSALFYKGPMIVKRIIRSVSKIKK